MALSNQIKNQHLLWRAGFGPAVEQLNDVSKFTPKDLFAAMVKASSQKPSYINVADNYLQELMTEANDGERIKKKDLERDERKMIQQKNREGVKNLNIYWMNEMVNSGAQLREKMAFFWHGHFACRNLNIFYQQGLLASIREHALGNFGELLKEVSRSAAMLNFLNNQQNKKGHPNENFAREVMELFTLGRGNYSENDVKEGARAFTGWSANARGEFVFRRGQHDDGSKAFLGQTGNLDGDAVLDIILEQKQTAKFITTKVYKFFVNEKIDEEKVNWLSDRFFKNKYDIAKLMEDIFLSDWFYSPANVGTKIKSPVELLVGIQRMLPMTLQTRESLLLLQRLLGQMLFYPPNVAGWAGGRNWIDSSTLMLRMRIPQLFNDVDELNVTPKTDDDQMMGRSAATIREEDKLIVPGNEEKFNKVKKKSTGKGSAMINANIDWENFIRHFEKTEREQLEKGLVDTLLQTGGAVSADLIRAFADNTGRESFIRTAAVQIMSTPEYQLC